MKSFSSLVFAAILMMLSSCRTDQPGIERVPPLEPPALMETARFGHQVTGVAISQQGRVFVNFPRWSETLPLSVAEVMADGSLRPFPDASWNSWRSGESPAMNFVCVQSVYVDRNDDLWILDPASPFIKGVVPGGPKLVRVALSDNQVKQIIRFGTEIAFPNSYLNDVRIDEIRKIAYITDSGTGAIIVVDLKSGESRRLLADHPSTKADPGVTLTINGKPVQSEKGTPQIHADGIALDSDREYLYYQALTGRTLYRIETRILLDKALPADQLGAYVEKVAEIGPVDGIFMDDADNLYYTDLERNGVGVYRPNGTKQLLMQNDELQWPDSIAIGPNDYLYVTASQIHRMPRFNGGVDRRVAPYKLFRFWLRPFGLVKGSS